jgi:hypothetical protein
MRTIFALILLFTLGTSAMVRQAASTDQLIDKVITRPWPGTNFPPLPALPSTLREQVSREIQSSIQVREAYEKLDAARMSNVQWFEAVESLEKQRALWSLLSALCHPSDDVQIHALRSLKRLNDKRGVPFLLVYAESMAEYEGGSENATIHGVIHKTVAETLSTITGIQIEIRGQDVERLRAGISLWRDWLKEQQR